MTGESAKDLNTFLLVRISHDAGAERSVHAQVVPVLAATAGGGEGARLLARYNVSKDAAYSARTRKKGDRVQTQVTRELRHICFGHLWAHGQQWKPVAFCLTSTMAGAIL